MIVHFGLRFRMDIKESAKYKQVFVMDHKLLHNSIESLNVLHCVSMSSTAAYPLLTHSTGGVLNNASPSGQSA
jgi:hypothetical protein